MSTKAQPLSQDKTSARDRVAGAAWWALVCAAVALVVLGGLRLSFIATSSMEPALGPRDGLVTVSPNLKRPDIGDVVVARPHQAGVDLPAIAHRVIAREGDAWRTKGDASPRPDTWLVQPEDVVGVSIAKVPSGLLQTPWLMLFLLVSATLGWLWPEKATFDDDDEAAPLSLDEHGRPDPVARVRPTRASTDRVGISGRLPECGETIEERGDSQVEHGVELVPG